LKRILNDLTELLRIAFKSPAGTPGGLYERIQLQGDAVDLVSCEHLTDFESPRLSYAVLRRLGLYLGLYQGLYLGLYLYACCSDFQRFVLVAALLYRQYIGGDALCCSTLFLSLSLSALCAGCHTLTFLRIQARRVPAILDYHVEASADLERAAAKHPKFVRSCLYAR
jgi:hypothetical protein